MWDIPLSHSFMVNFQRSISIVFSKGAFVNKLRKSYEIYLYPLGIFAFLILLTNSQMFLILYSDDINDDKRVAKYLEVSYVAVPTFNVIDVEGKFSTVSFYFNF